MIGKLKRKYFPRRNPKNIGKYIIASNKYGDFCIPSKVYHRGVAQRILSGEVHEESTIEAIKKYYKPGTAVIHAGTFFGDMLPALSEICDTVYAFEPNIENYKAADITIRINELNNVILQNLALGNEDQTKKLQTTRAGENIGGGSFISDEGDQSVRMVRLDELIERAVSVIHLDAERSEMNIIEGAKKMLEQYEPVLILESYDQRVLNELGYREIDRAGRNRIFSK